MLLREMRLISVISTCKCLQIQQMWTPPPSVKIHPSPSFRAATLCNKDSSYAKDTTLQVVRCFWQAVLLGNRDANCSHGALTMTSQQLKECGTFCSIQSLWVIYMPDNKSSMADTSSDWSDLEHFHHSVIFHKDRLSNNTTLKHLWFCN